MNLNPRQHKPGLCDWQATGEQCTIQNRSGSVLPLVFGVNVRQLMTRIIKEIQADDDSIKHADGWQGRHSLMR
jgi:hypothetical protein